MIVLALNEEGWWVRDIPEQPLPSDCTAIVTPNGEIVEGYADQCMAGMHEPLPAPSPATLFTAVNGARWMNQGKVSISHLSEIIPKLPPCRKTYTLFGMAGPDPLGQWTGAGLTERMEEVEWMLVVTEGTPLPLEHLLGSSRRISS